MIKDLAELKKLLALCRKQGVKEIKFGDVSVVLGDLPPKKVGDVEESEGEEMSDEEMIMYSVREGLPG